MKKLVVLASVVVFMWLMTWTGVALAGVEGETTCQMKSTTLSGKPNLWYISANGLVGIDSSVQEFKGVSYQIIELGGNQKTYTGFTNLPDAPPLAGKATVKVEGCSPVITTKGTYRATFTMQYKDKNGDIKEKGCVWRRRDQMNVQGSGC